eukprot:scaffold291_cov332-Pavlova_lutheri.AAC.4
MQKYVRTGYSAKAGHFSAKRKDAAFGGDTSPSFLGQGWVIAAHSAYASIVPNARFVVVQQLCPGNNADTG